MRAILSRRLTNGKSWIWPYFATQSVDFLKHMVISSLSRITDCCDHSHIPISRRMRSSGNLNAVTMENPSLVLAISKLAAAGEQAGFTLEQMIDLLDHGLEVETLLELICLRLHPAALRPAQDISRYRWVVGRGVPSCSCVDCPGMACDCSDLVPLEEDVTLSWDLWTQVM
jgi:hypothetical protein